MPVFIGSSNLNSVGYSSVFNEAVDKAHITGSLTGEDVLNSENFIKGRLADHVVFVPDSSTFGSPINGECSVLSCLPGGLEIAQLETSDEIQFAV